MSSEAAASGGAAAKPPTRLLHHFDNHGIWPIFAMLVATSIISAVGASDGFDTVFWVTLAVMIPYTVALFIAGRRHRPGLCAHCFNAFPLNPGEYAATRARPALRTAHLLYNGLGGLIAFLARFLRYKILTLIGYCAVILAVMWPVGWLLGGWFSPLFIGALILYSYAEQQHRKLQIWCPWCDHGRGDDDDPEVDPGPEPADGINPEQVRA